MKPSLIIVGLGNPGDSYARTRHNAGFQAIDVLSEAFGEGEWEEKQKFLSLTQEARILTIPVLLVKPLTFMNRSGEALTKLVGFYKADAAEQILVLCDDIDINLGEARLRKSGGPGTHNGLRSIAQTFGEEFPRLRIGIGPKPPVGDLAAWVLSTPSAEDASKLKEVLSTLPEKIRAYVLSEPEKERA